MAQKPQATPKEAAKVAGETTQAKKRPAASEIDDIFAKKSKSATASTTDSTDSSTASKKKQKKKKDQKEAVSPEAPLEAQEEATSIAQPKKVPETVVDTSKVIEAYKPAAAQTTKKAKDMTEEEKKAAEEERQFRDSRGTSESSFFVLLSP